jgi:hypothetical protein
MAKGPLSAGQRRTVAMITGLVFGRIDGLLVHDGQPCYDPAPRIVQEIKLGAEPGPPPDRCNADVTLKKEFENLFRHLRDLGEGVVAIEVRHCLPFRIVLERRYTDLSIGVK